MGNQRASVLVHLAGPAVRTEVRRLVRELTRLSGISRVVPTARVARLLAISYDPKVIALRTLFAHVRRTWIGARIAGTAAEMTAVADRPAHVIPPAAAALQHVDLLLDRARFS